MGVRQCKRNSACRLMAVGLAITMFLAGCGGGGSGGDNGPTWTVMVYLDGDNNLEEAALADFNEMEAAMGGLDMTIIVLFDRSSSNSRAQGDWDETRLYEIQHDTDPSAIASKRLIDRTWLGLDGNEADELNMGSGETLKNFVSFCKNTYPSDHTALILWDHGSGWAPAFMDTLNSDTKFIAIDDESAGDALSMKELAAALEGQSVDLLGFDACLMAEVEVAWELRGSARYMVASEGLEPSFGWDYTALLNQFSGLPGAEKTPEALARCIADSYMAAAADMELTLSVVDLAALAPLGEAVDALALEMMALGADAVTMARYGTAHYNENTCVDLRQFAEKLGASPEIRNILDAALSRAVIYVVATHPENACGLSIYFPIFGYSSGQFSDYTPENLTFTEETSWKAALTDYRSKALYYRLETVPGTQGLDTRLDLYTDSLSFIAGNDDKTSGDRFSRVKLPVARGESYYLRIASGSPWGPGAVGIYGVYAGTDSGDLSSPVMDPEGDGDYDRPDYASSLPVNTVQAHSLSSGDEDWVRFTVPVSE